MFSGDGMKWILYFSTTNVFGYNTRSELTSAQMDTNMFAYLYDDIGNRKEASANAVMTYYEANELNQYTEIEHITPINPAYDADGNLTHDGTNTYSWDAENRLVEVSSGGALLIQNTYDYMSRRIQKVAGTATNRFLYDGWNMIIEERGNSLYSYVWGLDLSGTLQGAGGVGGLAARARHIISGTNLIFNSSEYYVGDANGDITDFIYASYLGAKYSYSYDAYGNSLQPLNPTRRDRKFRFSSKYCDDETGLYYYGLRWYSSLFGKWLTRDPLEENIKWRASNGHTSSRVYNFEEVDLNLYQFARNNSLLYIDALGLKVQNNCTKPICVKPENGTVPVVIQPGESYDGPIDGVTDCDGKVVKITDPYNDSSIDVGPGGVNIPGPDWLGSKKLACPPDKGWDPLFECGKNNK